MTSRSELLADVILAIDYREDKYDADAIVADIIRTHGRVRLADLAPQTFAAIAATHTR